MYKVIVIGSGNAGYTAAIYAARSQLFPVLFSGAEVGGQLATTTEVENFPGFPKGIQGPDLMQNVKEQAERFGTEIIKATIHKIDFSHAPFTVWANEKEYQAEAVIIATGASTKWLGLESETRLRGHGVSSCATCDGFFFKDKDIVVVGGGDSAMEEATFLTKFAKSVQVVHRKDVLRASKIMQERALANKKISFVWNTEVVEVLGEQTVTGVRVKNTQTNEESEISCQGVFVAIGHEPNTELFKGVIDVDEKGYILTREHTMTNIPGVFAAGDVVDHRYRQAVTAAGMGCMAAIDVERWLTENN